MRYTPAIAYETKTQRHYTISTFSGATQAGATAVSASMAWPAASVMIAVPIYIAEFCTIYEVGTGAGATAGGNFEIGLYGIDQSKKQSTGTVARTASAWNPNNWTDLDVTPGWYYAAMVADGTNNYAGWPVANGGVAETVGICEQTSVTTGSMPSTATLVRTTRTQIPLISFAVRSIAI